MTLSDISIRNPVFAWMLMAAFILFGFLCFIRMGLSSMPDVNFPVVNISITLPNAAPEVVESGVADPVESAVLGVEGVQDVQTSCTQGNANISVYLDLSRNVDVAVQDVQTMVFQAQRQLPTNVFPAVIRKYNPNNSPILWLAITADPPLTTRDMMLYARDHIRDHFTSVDGVAQVFLGGFMDREINIWIDNNKLNARQLTAQDIINTIQHQHQETPAGYMETPDKQYSIRIMGEAYTVPDFANLPILTRGGSPNYTLTRLKDIATIEDGIVTPVTRLSRFGGEPAVGMGIVMQDGYNAVEVADAVKARMAEVIKQLDKGYHISLNFDTTKFIRDNVHELEITLGLATLLTSLVCFFFLGSWSSTINIFLAIPTSIFGTFLVIYFFGFTLNTFTLLALSLSIGVVVDDAIMVLENIVRHQEKGEDMVQAALKGAREVTFAATATSLAIVAIFLPIAFMQGIIGKFFFQFGVTLSGAVLISLLEAITLTPMRCSEFVHAGSREDRLSSFINDRFIRLSRFYSRTLEWCLYWKTGRLLDEFKTGNISPFHRLASWLFFINKKKLVAEVEDEIGNQHYSTGPMGAFLLGVVILLALNHFEGRAWHIAFLSFGGLFLLGILAFLWHERHFFYSHLFYDRRMWVLLSSLVIFAGSLFMVKFVRKEFVPSTDMSAFVVNMKLPVGYSLEHTNNIVKQCEAALKQRGELKNLYTPVGGFGGNSPNTAMFFLTMKDPGDRDVVPLSEKSKPRGPLGFVNGFFRHFFKQRLTQAEFMQVVRASLSKISPDLQVSIQDFSMRGWSTGRGYAAELLVTGPDWDTLTDCVKKIRAKLRSDKRLADVDDNFLDGQPEVRVIPDRAKAALMGVNMDDLGSVLAATIGSYQFQGVYFHEGGHDNYIALRVPMDERQGPDAIKNIHVRNNRGEVLPLSEVTTLQIVPALQQITRDNRRRSVFFYANPGTGTSQTECVDAAVADCKSILPDGYSVQLTGTSQSNANSFSQLGLVMILGIIVAYMVLGSQFNSFIHPFTILLALPFSVTGAIFSLWTFNQGLSIYSFIGIILLMGLVKKNSIMLVDFTNQRRAQGMSVQDALLAACPIRLRPILMTSTATVAGAIPAALALGPGAEMRQPMSVAIIGGIIFSTILTLVVVPCAYSVLVGLERRKAHHAGYQNQSVVEEKGGSNEGGEIFPKG